jgi:hypothetical protein
MYENYLIEEEILSLSEDSLLCLDFVLSYIKDDYGLLPFEMDVRVSSSVGNFVECKYQVSYNDLKLHVYALSDGSTELTLADGKNPLYQDYSYIGAKVMDQVDEAIGIFLYWGNQC